MEKSAPRVPSNEAPGAETLDLVSANPALVHALSEQMGKLGTLVAWASPAAAVDAWAARAPTLVLWDDALSWADLQAALAGMDPKPFIMVLGQGPDADEGGVESLPKPFRLGVLWGRLQFALQLKKRVAAAALDLGIWRLDGRTRHLVQKDTGVFVSLTDKEAALVGYLARAGGPVTKDDILAAVWGYGSGLDTHTLETHIYRLRRKLLEAGFMQGADPFQLTQGRLTLNPAWEGE